MAEALSDLKFRMTAREYAAAKRLSFRRPGRRWLIGAASAVTVSAVALGIWLLTKPTLAFEGRDRLMVADVDNLTGDQVFDLALRMAIEADLQQSPYAAIFDKPQISETLRLMRTDPSSRIDEALGYEVCRFGQVRAFILPRIMSVGDAYELQAILIDPVRRRHVDRIRITAKGKEDVLLHGIDKLAQRVRSRLGESLQSIEKADRPVVNVTTSSWDALNYMSMGLAKWQEGKYKEAAVLLELALEKDPKFVDARGSLGLVLVQFLNQKEKGKAMLRQALEDAQNQDLPQRDLLKLKATHKQFVEEDLAGALEEYHLMQELYPDFMPPWNNAGRIFMAMGKFDEAAAMFEKAAEVAPRNSIPLQNLWFVQLLYTKDPRAGEQTARRMVSLAPQLAYPFSFLGFSLAAQGRLDEAEQELHKAIAIEPDHPYALANLAHVLFASGRAVESVALYKKILELTRQGKTSGDVEGDAISLALALRESGDIEGARSAVQEVHDLLLKKIEGSSPTTGDLFSFGELEAILGRTAKAESYLAKILQKNIQQPDELMDLAEFYALLGRDELAVSTLKRSLEAGYSDYFFPVIMPAFQKIRNHPEFRSLFKLGE
jgi:Flp pilus assembly protein TadD